jgi:hypothetical protein
MKRGPVISGPFFQEEFQKKFDNFVTIDRIFSNRGDQMKKQKTSPFAIFKQMSIYGIGFGIIFFIFSFFANGSNFGYIMSILGIGFSLAAVYLFLIGLAISLMEEYGANSKKNQHAKGKMTVYSRK